LRDGKPPLWYQGSRGPDDPAPVPQALRNRGWRRRGTLAEVETIRHVIRAGVARIQGGEAEVHLAEFQQAHVRVEGFGDVAVSRVRAQRDASHARTVSKLASLVAGMCTFPCHTSAAGGSTWSYHPPQSSQVRNTATSGH